MLEIKIMKKMKLIMVSIAKKHQKKKPHRKPTKNPPKTNELKNTNKSIKQTNTHTQNHQIQRTINWKQTQKFKNSMEMFDDLMFNCLTD